MRAVAAFASSESGKAFARVEQYYGRDPASSLEDLDDVLAHNLRAAFMVTLAPDEEPEDEHAALVKKTQKAGEAIRSHIG